ncbi:MAG: UDP-3-O-(3-hydroxymyristoyl)glucosamine N-acyltransferase [Pseudobdellovibrio sp.]
MKSISIDQISSKASENLVLRQRFENTINEVLPAEIATTESLVFASSKLLCEKAIENKVAALILTETVYAEVEKQFPKNVSVWTTKNIHAAMSSVLQLFDLKRDFLTQGVHPTAQIHPTAKISAKAHIGAFAVIEAHASIGDDTIIFPHVYVGPYCEVGARCYISSFVAIGSDGFGFYTDKTFKHHKVPQIGRVVIEDDCEFGAHCAIDRATLTETRIKKGSKFDNFCHIAHNVTFGENALVAAGFIVAGSTTIGKNLMTSGGVHILGHLTVPDNVILSGRAGVTQSIEKSGMYGGFPLEEHRESTKTHVSIPHIKKLRKQVRKILKHLNLNEEE